MHFHLELVHVDNFTEVALKVFGFNNIVAVGQLNALHIHLAAEKTAFPKFNDIASYPKQFPTHNLAIHIVDDIGGKARRDQHQEHGQAEAKLDPGSCG